jgi:hypothetical protein
MGGTAILPCHGLPFLRDLDINLAVLVVILSQNDSAALGCRRTAGTRRRAGSGARRRWPRRRSARSAPTPPSALGQLQPLMAAFPQECMAQLGYLARLNSLLAPAPPLHTGARCKSTLALRTMTCATRDSQSFTRTPVHQYDIRTQYALAHERSYTHIETSVFFAIDNSYGNIQGGA